MPKFTVQDARKELGKLIVRAKAGEEIVISRYGKDEVRLLAVTSDTDTFPDLSGFRNSMTVKGGDDLGDIVKEMREEAPY
jgi:prevent-host-death family protein